LSSFTKMKGKTLIVTPSKFEAEALKELNLKIEICGVGVIEAAIESYRLIKKYKPALIVLTGLAGGYPETGLFPGDIVIASKEVWADSGRKIFQNYAPLPENLGMKKEIEIDKNLLEIFALPEGIKTRIGAMCTVCACSYEKERAKKFSKIYKALAENMEGFAVALAAKKAGICFAEVRAISNLLSDPEAPWDTEKAFNSLRRFWECQSLK